MEKVGNEWRFTEDERYLINDSLRKKASKITRENLEAFILQLQYCCHKKKQSLERSEEPRSMALKILQKVDQRKNQHIDFLNEILKIYEQYFNKPTKYRYGPFFNIIRTLLEALNLPSEDPSRAIEQLIK